MPLYSSSGTPGHEWRQMAAVRFIAGDVRHNHSIGSLHYEDRREAGCCSEWSKYQDDLDVVLGSDQPVHERIFLNFVRFYLSFWFPIY